MQFGFSIKWAGEESRMDAWRCEISPVVWWKILHSVKSDDRCRCRNQRPRSPWVQVEATTAVNCHTGAVKDVRIREGAKSLRGSPSEKVKHRSENKIWGFTNFVVGLTQHNAYICVNSFFVT